MDWPVSSNQTSYSLRLGWFQAVGLALILLLFPLAMGGMVPGPRSLMIVAVAVLFAAQWLPRFYSGVWWDRWDRGWFVVWFVVSAYIALQLIPMPAGLGGLLGPYPDLLLESSDIPIGRITPTPLNTVSYWAIFTAYWAVAWLVASLNRRQLMIIVGAMFVLVSFEALYGMLAFVQGQESILGIWPKKYYRGDVTGTFVNKNHFAGLLEVGWPLVLAFWFVPPREGGFRFPQPLRYGIAALLSLIIGLALLNSHSRLGVAGALVGLATWAWLAARHARQTGGNFPRWLPWAAVVVAVLAGIWFGIGPLVGRYAEILGDSSRIEIWTAMFSFSWKTWLVGTGAGSFEDVFKLVHPPSIHSYYYAHSDWLQFVLEFGLLGTGLIVFAMIIWFRRVRPARLSLLQTAAVGSVAAIAFHSLGDFNLQIPGTAFAFWVAVGILFNRELGYTIVSRES